MMVNDLFNVACLLACGEVIVTGLLIANGLVGG
jgi:hypothetical protein